MQEMLRPGVERLETPERVDLSVDLAGPGSRTCACLLDVLLIGVSFLVLVLVVLMTSFVAGTAALILVIGGGFVLQWGYFALFEALWDGQTPGKRALGLRVRRIGGYPIGWTESLIRNFLRVVDFLFAGAVGMVAMLLNDRHQRIGDLAAGTVVVREGPDSLTVLDEMGYGPLAEGVARRTGGPDLPAREFETLHDFLGRRSALQPEAFSRIQADLARGLRKSLGERGGLLEEWKRTPDGPFLELLHAAYTGDRGAAVDIRDFVAQNRGDWGRLEALIGVARRRGLASLGHPELREMGSLHRKVSADVAASRTFHWGSRVVDYLNSLAIRSHNVVYRAPRKSLRQRLSDLAREIPAAVRSHRGALAASTVIFSVGVLLGAFGTVLDEGVAVLVLGTSFVERIRRGEFWVERIFDVVPHSVASARLLSNNLSVAIFAFALGLTGLFTALILFLNGVMLGAVLVLCSQYGLLSRFLPFVAPHGIIEISAILLAGAGGFTVFDGWLSPGDATRMQGLRRGARQGLRIALAAVPALIAAGFVEGLISPIETVPAWLRIALGVCLGLAFWSWIFFPASGLRVRHLEPDPGRSAAGT